MTRARAKRGTNVAFWIRVRRARASGYTGTTYRGRDKLLLILGWSGYREYLASPLWAAIRRMVYRLKGTLCCKCRRKAQALHHQRYDTETLAGNSVRHIYPICDGCHRLVEFDGDGDKRDFRSARAVFAAMPSPRRVTKTRPPAPRPPAPRSPSSTVRRSKKRRKVVRSK